MKLEEAFEKYDDNVRLRRTSYECRFQHIDPKIVKEHLASGLGSATIKFLKMLKAWGNEESRELGFIIPDFMIEDANADDWEIVDET